MRTRARTTMSPRSTSPPLTRSKKRDSGIGMEDALNLDEAYNGINSPFRKARPNPSTPRKTTKRVRFSDPGLQRERDLLPSTGLTPHLRRTRLSPRTGTSGRERKQRLRRASLPANLASIDTSDDVEIIRFTPLKQVLDERVKRRLRRNHLSEEVNDYEAQKRDSAKVRRELETVRNQSEQKEARIRELMFELETQRQMGIEVNDDEERKIRTLQEELTSLKHKQLAIKEESDRMSYADTEIATEFDYDGGRSDLGSPWEEDMFPDSPCRIVRSMEPFTNASALETNDASAQVSLPDPILVQKVEGLAQAVKEHKRMTSDAQAVVATIHSELQALGFAAADSDIEQILEAVREAFRTARLQLEYMLPGETPGGFENGSLLPLMVHHVRTLLDRLTQATKSLERQEKSEAALRGQFNSTLSKVEELEKTNLALAASVDRKRQLVTELGLAADARTAVMAGKDALIVDLEQRTEEKSKQNEAARDRIVELETEAQDASVSLKRLQSAVQSYEREVTSLEALVTSMEEKSKSKGRTCTQLLDVVAEQTRRFDEMAEQQRGLASLARDLT